MLRMIDLQEKLIERLTNQIEALRKERPMWAQGFTSDSVAAQESVQEPVAYFWRDKAEGTVGLRFTMPEWVDDPDKERYELVRLYAAPVAAAAPGVDERKGNPECIHCNGAGEVTIGGRLIFPCPCRA